MTDTVHADPGADTDASDGAEIRTPTQFVLRIVRDGLIGAIGGAVGSIAAVGSLLIALLLDGFSLEAFRQFPATFGLGAIFSPDQLLAVGIVSFVVGGMVVWPLMLSTIGLYLPGEKTSTKGLFFGGVIWTGFVFYFYTGATGAGLVAYLVLSFLGHLGYGFLTGATMDRLFGEEGPLVSSTFRRASGSETQPTADRTAGLTQSGHAQAESSGAAGGSRSGSEPTGGSEERSTPARVSDPATSARAETTDSVAPADGDAETSATGETDGVETNATESRNTPGSSSAPRATREPAVEALRHLDEDAEGVAPLLRFKEALLKIRAELGDEVPREYYTAVEEYLSVAREPTVQVSHVNDLRGYILVLKDTLPEERAVQRWVDSMTARVRQYLDTHDTSETLHLGELRIYEDGTPVDSVADLQGELATIEVTVQNQGGESGAVVRLEFRREDDQPGTGTTDGSGVLLRSDDLSVGTIEPGERRNLSTQVYVPSIAEWCDARVLDPREGQVFLSDVDELRGE